MKISSPKSCDVEIIAHRGASYDAPENTAASFNLGWRQNADACELDINFSGDGQIVVIHDHTTGRTAGYDKKVSEQTFCGLRKLDAGSWKGPQWKGEKIPSLGEVLETIPDGKRILIEIKTGPEILTELERVFKVSGKKPQQMPIISFSYEVVKRAKDKFPEHEVYFLYGWKDVKDEGGQLSIDELIDIVKSAGLDGVDVNYGPWIDAVMVKKVRDAGLKFYVWTVDDPVAAKKLASYGADGITTNRPQWIREELG